MLLDEIIERKDYLENRLNELKSEVDTEPSTIRLSDIQIEHMQIVAELSYLIEEVKIYI